MIRIYLCFLLSMSLHITLAQTSPADSIKLPPRDTVIYTMQQAENLFLTRNLSLVAQKYSIDSARATVITAKLYDNPGLNFSTGFYQPETKKFLDLNDSRRETAIQLSQLFKTAGKRNKAITLSTSGIDVAQFQFYDLMRTLKFVLRADFFNIYFLERSEKLYEQEISSLRSIVPAYEQQEKKGYIALKDVLRIKSQLYTLQAEYNDLQVNIDNIQSELKTILRERASSYIVPLADTSILYSAVVSQQPMQRLLDTAMVNRPDVKALRSNIAFSQNNLQLQKALAKPDVTVSLNYDRLGSYVKYFNSIGVGIPLPLFNRNQGNIRSAHIQVDLNNVLYEAGVDKVKNDVTTSYNAALRAEKLLLSFDPGFDKQLSHLNEEVFKNFKKRNVTILEFLDFYESFKQNVLQLNRLRFNKMNALEQLNFSIGKTIFN